MKNDNYETIIKDQSPYLATTLNRRSEALAARLESGATALADFAATLSEAEWQTRLPKDGRKIGVVVHHVASMYTMMWPGPWGHESWQCGWFTRYRSRFFQLLLGLFGNAALGLASPY